MRARTSRAVRGNLPSLASSVKPESRLYYLSHQKLSCHFSDRRTLTLMLLKVNQHSLQTQSPQKSGSEMRARRAGWRSSWPQGVTYPGICFLTDQGAAPLTPSTSPRLTTKELGRDPPPKSHSVLQIMTSYLHLHE